MRKTYRWRRFWVREGTELLLEDEAYLPDPKHDFAQYLNPGIETLKKICEEPCAILLGEPGMGKSRSLHADFDELSKVWASTNAIGPLIDIGAVTGLTDLQSLLLNDPRVVSWLGSSGILHLGLDSLDEALPSYSGLPKALMDVIRKFPKERLRLLIACRAGEFPPYLQDELEAHFGPERVTRWQLAPLRRMDVQLAATENALDANAFMTALGEREVQPLAARPITLEPLLGAAALGLEMLSDVWSLYERGCRKLLSERQDSSRFTQAQAMELDQKVAIGGRIACITIFGAFTAVETNPDSGGPGGIVASKDLAGGQEISLGNPFPVAESSIQDVLKTGIFTATGLTFRWSHKSYSEFFAAYHLRTNAVSKNQIMSLVGCAGRVAPALRGVTAWLASKDEDIFREVLRVDPEVLLFSDLSAATDQQRSELVGWLLAQAAAGSPLIQEWGISWTYRKLKHAGLKDQLQRVIGGPASVGVRHSAVLIANACGGVGLQSELADLALRDIESTVLRIAAASCVAGHAEGSIKARLLPLALQINRNEEEERLRAEALSAVWPEHCTWPQIRDSLGTGDWSTTTALGRFLAFDLAKDLPTSELAEALTWSAQKNWAPSGLSAWAVATDHLLTRAVMNAENASVRRAAVETLFRRISKHFQIFPNSRPDGSAELWTPDARRAIAADLFPRFAADPNLVNAALRCPTPLLNSDDVGFVMERWAIAPANEKRVWEAAIGWLVDWGDAGAASAVLVRAHRFPALCLKLEEQRYAFLSRIDRERRDQTDEESRKRKLTEERISQIQILLGRSEADSKFFGDLLYIMSFPLDAYWGSTALGPGIRDLPGWLVLSADEQERLIAAGKVFLKRECPYALTGLRRGGQTRNSSAGYRILSELAVLEPGYIENLSILTWKRWAPGIILVQCDLSDSQYGDVDRALLRLSASRAKGCLTRTLGIAIRRQNYGAGRQLQRMVGVLGCDAFDANSFSSLLDPQVSSDMYVTGIRRLLECSHEDAIRMVEGALERVQKATVGELPKLALNAALWLEHTHGNGWAAAWQEMLARPEFAPMLLDALGRERKAISHIDEWLSDQQLADLYVWLRKEFGAAPGLPTFVSQPQWDSQGRVLSVLQRRRRPPSIAMLERIEEMFPQDWHVRKATWDAKRLLIEATWEPLAPAEIKRIVEDKRQLLVRDEQELMEAVWAALQDYQNEIRAEGSRVMRLWNEPVHTPKPEEPLSREIGAELQRVLASRGVKITHEVKIREKQFIDIYVSAVTSNSQRRLISLIIEVKGCWHKELKTALDTQLSMRYLKDSESHFGIYLAVWFLCDEWDGRRDKRKGTTPHQSLSAIRAFLKHQASEITAHTQSTIRALVLDATIEGSGPKLDRTPR